VVAVVVAQVVAVVVDQAVGEGLVEFQKVFE